MAELLHPFFCVNPILLVPAVMLLAVDVRAGSVYTPNKIWFLTHVLPFPIQCFVFSNFPLGVIDGHTSILKCRDCKGWMILTLSVEPQCTRAGRRSRLNTAK